MPIRNTGGIKPNASDSQKYSNWGDTRMRSLVKTIGTLIAIVIVSGKMVEYFVDNYVMSDSAVSLGDLPKGGAQNRKMALLTGEEAETVSLYKSEHALTSELDNLSKLSQKHLEIPKFWSKGRNYFVQVVGGDQANPEAVERMDPHYYHLKKLCRRRSVPLYAYKIDVRDFKDEATWGKLRE